METFTAWLSKQLRDKDLSMRELARRSNVSIASVSRVLSGKQAITADFCKAVAHALDVDPNELMWMSGIVENLPAPPSASESAREMLEIFTNLSDSERQEMLAIGRLKLERQQRGKRGQRAGLQS